MTLVLIRAPAWSFNGIHGMMHTHGNAKIPHTGLSYGFFGKVGEGGGMLQG